MIIRDTSTPVVILRSDSHGGLNIMRSLGPLGVRIYNVDPNRCAPAFFSRYCQGRFVWDIDHEPADKSVDYLSVVSKKIGRPAILIPTTDRTAGFVADHVQRLKQWFIFPDQHPGLVSRLSNKMEMFRLAQRIGIPTPETAQPRSRPEVLGFMKSARFPIMLKAIDGQRLWEKCRKKMFIVKTPQELLEKYDLLEDPANPNLCLQEYIPGNDDTVWMFNGYFDATSKCLVGFTGKKIRQCPVYTGSTSLGICLHNKEVASLATRFMKSISYRGILDIGFRYDARDGSYNVLDVNPRIGATFRLFVGENGIDVARALYLDMTGQSVPASPAREGRRWVVEDLDLVSSYRYWRDGKLTLTSWLKSFRGVEETAFFNSQDLLPLLPLCASRLVELLRRSLRLISSKLARRPELDFSQIGTARPLPGK